MDSNYSKYNFPLVLNSRGEKQRKYMIEYTMQNEEAKMIKVKNVIQRTGRNSAQRNSQIDFGVVTLTNTRR